MINDPKKYAAIYVRQSNLTDKNSRTAQTSYGYEMALKNNLIVYKVYSEKISASTVEYTKREQLQNLLRDARQGYFKTIIIYKRDRLARNMDEFTTIKKELRRLDIKILYSSEGEYQPNETYISDFIENILMAVAEIEPSNIKARTDDGKRKLREAGIYSSSQDILGLRKEKEKKERDTKTKILYSEYVKTDDAVLVKKIFEEFLKLDEKKVKSMSQAAKIIGNNIPELRDNFNSTFLKKIISKPVYEGLQTKSLDYKYNNFILTDNKGNVLEIEPDSEYFHECTNISKEERIITKDQWYEAIRKYKSISGLKSKNKKYKSNSSNYLFKGFMYCSKCKSKIYLRNNKYACAKKCINVNRREFIIKVLEKLLPELLNVDTLKSAVSCYTRNLKQQIENLKITLSGIINEQSKLIDIYLDKLNNGNIEDDLIKKTKEKEVIENKIKVIGNKISYLNNEFFYGAAYLLSVRPDLAVNYITFEEERLQGLLSGVYKEVYIENDLSEITTSKGRE